MHSDNKINSCLLKLPFFYHLTFSILSIRVSVANIICPLFQMITVFLALRCQTGIGNIFPVYNVVSFLLHALIVNQSMLCEV